MVAVPVPASTLSSSRQQPVSAESVQASGLRVGTGSLRHWGCTTSVHKNVLATGWLPLKVPGRMSFRALCFLNPWWLLLLIELCKIMLIRLPRAQISSQRRFSLNPQRKRFLSYIVNHWLNSASHKVFRANMYHGLTLICSHLTGRALVASTPHPHPPPRMVWKLHVSFLVWLNGQGVQ